MAVTVLCASSILFIQVFNRRKYKGIFLFGLKLYFNVMMTESYSVLYQVLGLTDFNLN
jgi:hypothetical protein